MLSSRLGNSMDNRLKFPLTHSLLLLLCYAAAAVVAGSATPEYRRSRASATYYPQPHDFPNERLHHAYVIIQRFKNTVTCDPRHITSSWIGHNICGKKTYVGFECATLPGHGNNLTVTSVSFDGFGLCAPRLQGFIDQLPDLALFQASANNFGGDIPSLAGLDYLLKIQTIDAYAQADFSAGTPQRPEFLYLCLKYLLCRLENTLHKELVPDYTNGKALILNNNFQSGSLPANLGFSKLSYLALANNNLSGTIPPSIQHLQGSLIEILLLNNRLSGCLPHELGMLTNAAVIDAGMNQITGPIPSSFSCLSSVEQLNLAGNRLYGEVPDALCKLAAGPSAGRLANISLSSNYFTSVGRACAAMIKDGVLDVKNNCIPGLDNQRPPVECAAFLRQPKMCRESSTQTVTCPAAASENAAARGNRKAARDYHTYVTYATLRG